MDDAERQVGGYRLLRRIGAGGMGTVHEAVDLDGRRVALKLLHPQIAADPQARRRLAREVSLLHRVREAGVARVLDAEVDDDEAFVVTELIDGLTLEEDVADGGPFSPDELAALGRDLADALRAIHAVGVVHRDLKPGNVMMSSNGPVVIDFGIAQVADDARLTQTGLVTGTPGYLGPEVLAGAEPSPAGDWWSWAAVLVFAATGRPPFGRGPTQAVLGRVATGQVDTDGLPGPTAQALRAALAPSPVGRLNADGVLAVLEGRWSQEQLTQVLDGRGGGATAVLPGAATAASAGAATAALPGAGGSVTAAVPTGGSTAALPYSGGAVGTGATEVHREGTTVLPAGRGAAPLDGGTGTKALPAPGTTARLGASPAGTEPAVRGTAGDAEPGDVGPGDVGPGGAGPGIELLEPSAGTSPSTRILPSDRPAAATGATSAGLFSRPTPGTSDGLDHTRVMPAVTEPDPAVTAVVLPPSIPPRSWRGDAYAEGRAPAGRSADPTWQDPTRTPWADGTGGQAWGGERPLGQPTYPDPSTYPNQYAYPGAEAVPPWAVPPRRRTGVVAVAGLGLSALAALRPGTFLLVAAAVLVLAAATGWAGRSRRARRLRRGPRSGDDTRMVLGLPWHLVRAVLTVVPGALVGAGVAAVAWWAGAGLADPRLTEPLVLWASGLLGLAAAWLTPTSAAAREGARAWIDVLTPGRGYRALLVVVVLLVTLVVAARVLSAPPAPVWAPLPDPTALLAGLPAPPGAA
ncbi:protein kinase [Georgenia sp. TF02-10]|uniref:serine/threonine-protein kinase n=1 Tax=Georgenia sp. TF02-10 TaxID=2917725 RepID=UPI001FA7B513|nr:serine/threonine-protein kinase [Georgenia sp. TF02-10]UNX55284.1 protein kinase [Georgenia sp. TF02-10]